jgi:microcystin-dependent protein
MPWGFFTSTGKEKLTEQEPNSVGLIIQYGSSVVPVGWLACEGQEVAIASYPDLYKAIGTNYGSLTNGSGADGNTHFRVPDLRGRIPVGNQAGAGINNSGKGSMSYGTSVAARTLGDWTGRETVALTPSESALPVHDAHSISSTSHSHSITGSSSHNHQISASDISYKTEGGGTSPSTSSTFGPWYATTGAASPGVSIPGGKSGITATNSEGGQSGDGHQNVKPCLVVNFIIKT